jgi:hypothetical protein
MKSKTIESSKGPLSRCFMEGEESIGCASDFLDLMANCPSTTIVLDKDALAPDFFKLRSGLAGEILQKVSNYRKRLLILGDFRGVASGALRDFIRESNRTGQVVFAADLAQGIELLR